MDVSGVHFPVTPDISDILRVGMLSLDGFELHTHEHGDARMQDSQSAPELDLAAQFDSDDENSQPLPEVALSMNQLSKQPGANESSSTGNHGTRPVVNSARKVVSIRNGPSDTHTKEALEAGGKSNNASPVSAPTPSLDMTSHSDDMAAPDLRSGRSTPTRPTSELRHTHSAGEGGCWYVIVTCFRDLLLTEHRAFRTCRVRRKVRDAILRLLTLY